MGTVNRYLSQRERIVRYERLMSDFSEFAAAQRDRNRMEDGRHAALECDIATNLAGVLRLEMLVKLMLQARYGTWRERRAARRKLRRVRR
jgi:hypothetical protein